MVHESTTLFMVVMTARMAIGSLDVGGMEKAPPPYVWPRPSK